MANYKLYKILSKERADSNTILFNLDDYVCYRTTSISKDEMYIYCADPSPFNTYRVGEYLQIDLDATCSKLYIHTFCDADVVRRAPSSMVPNVSTLTNVSREQRLAMGRMLDELVDQSEGRNEYTASMEIDPNTNVVKYSISSKRRN